MTDAAVAAANLCMSVPVKLTGLDLKGSSEDN